MQEERERRAEEAKQRKQQYEEERLKNEIAKVEEMVQVPAFQDELNTVSNLICGCSVLRRFISLHSSTDALSFAVFFGTLQSDQKPADLNGSAPTAAAASQPGAAPEKGMIALKSKANRLDDDAFFLGKSKGSKTAAPGTPAKKGGKVRALKLDLSILEALDKVKVAVPSSQEEVGATIEALEERKKF